MAQDKDTRPLVVPSKLTGRNNAELSTTGLRMSDGRLYEEVAQLCWPDNMVTYKTMMQDAAIQSAHNTIRSMIRRIKWDVKARTDNPTESQKAQVQFIKECMNDMTHSWGDFINEVLSLLIYGFSVHEKVFKYREGKDGKFYSKYNDGKLGWAKLPVRAQETIDKWIYSDYNRELIAIEQRIVESTTKFSKKTFTGTTIEIPRNRFLHFRHDVQRDNPEGNSPLKGCYVPWKYKVTYEELEGVGVSRDMRGMPVIDLPPEYMSEDASDDQKAVYQWAVDTIQNMWANESMGLVKPRYVDPETKVDIFDFRLMGVTGSGTSGKSFDLNAIINRYENKILMTYLADVLKMGQEAHGSFALSDNKTNLLAIGIEAILTEILEVINRDLIEQTLILNGWEVNEESPVICYEDLDERDLDSLGQFIQRCAAVGAIEVDQSLSESLRKIAKLAPPDRERPIDPNMTSKGISEAGKGMQSGMSNTNGEGGAADASAANKSNAS